MKNLFKDLFILDLANNHFGDVGHAKKDNKKNFLIFQKKKKLNQQLSSN